MGGLSSHPADKSSGGWMGGSGRESGYGEGEGGGRTNWFSRTDTVNSLWLVKHMNTQLKHIQQLRTKILWKIDVRWKDLEIWIHRGLNPPSLPPPPSLSLVQKYQNPFMTFILASLSIFLTYFKLFIRLLEVSFIFNPILTNLYPY